MAAVLHKYWGNFHEATVMNCIYDPHVKDVPMSNFRFSCSFYYGSMLSVVLNGEADNLFWFFFLLFSYWLYLIFVIKISQ